MTPDTLDHIIYGKALVDGVPGDDLHTLAHSGDLTGEDTARWRSMVALDPLPTDTSTQTIGLFYGPGRSYILARSHYQDQNQKMPVYEYVLLPARLVQQAAGKLDPLLSLMHEPIPLYDLAAPPTVAPLTTPDLPPWTFEERQARFVYLLDTLCDGDMERVLALLGAVIDSRHLTLHAFNGPVEDRLALVSGLLALLPAPARPALTFTTYTTAPDAISDLRLAFSDVAPASSRWQFNLSQHLSPGLSLLNHPYVALLRELWPGEPQPFIQALADMDPIADRLLPDETLSDGLAQVAGRVRLDRDVSEGQEVSPEALKVALSSGLPMSAELQHRYAMRLLRHALDARDTEAALIVALQMDADPALDATLDSVLHDALDSQPDSVYVFVRTRLNDAMDVHDTWIERLQAAALCSLRVAITGADPPTIINWLRLVSREPASYGLQTILREGILAAQERAHTDGELARTLLMLAVKRDPDTLDALLDDDRLLAVVPDHLGNILRDFSGDPQIMLQMRGPEMFLVAMTRAAHNSAAALFTPPVIDEIWKLYLTGQTYNQPPRYQPEQIIDLWIATGPDWLSTAAQQYILTLLLADEHDNLFVALAHNMAERGRLYAMLVDVLQSSQRGVDDLLMLVNRLLVAGDITQQQAADTYLALIDLREWRQGALSLVEQLARLVQQHPHLDLPDSAIWNLLDFAARTHSDMIARIGARQVFRDFEAQPADDERAEWLTRVADQLRWSDSAYQLLLNWWREHVRSQPVSRLTTLESLLDGRRGLEDLGDILRTALAFRRMLGSRSFSEFATAINTTAAVLDDLAESFEPQPRRALNFDQDTVRAELDHHESALSDQERRILAKNLKELAQIISDMGDHRSKANLMRRGDNVDRQLMSGEQQPAGAVDVLKWLAGYMDGIQDRLHEADE